MTKAHKDWKVLPHGKLQRVDDNMLTVTGDIPMPLMKLSRRMTIVRLKDGRLVVFSAMALDENGMNAIEAFGRPAFMVVPSDKHRLDSRIWKARYPQLCVATPPGSLEKVEDVVAVDTTSPQFDDPSVQFVAVPGTGDRESALVVTARSGTTLVLNDVIGNVHEASGIGGWLLRRFGFAGDRPQIPGVVRMVLLKDARALRAQLLRWADIGSLRRILVSHGVAIEDNPRQVLRDLAATLAP